MLSYKFLLALLVVIEMVTALPIVDDGPGLPNPGTLVSLQQLQDAFDGLLKAPILQRLPRVQVTLPPVPTPPSFPF
ncbi:hypothetical protein CAEBREN_10064 [Caenorhabditis brenneri]|uniref:Secreted protein n=1 Tax=Caenorhabditis brenneri TaxID=135651 RepID=G0NY54_CAEBE|nr:hypothetical protein CAEBREN_10064 [Caenorhabditis brenneri]